MNQDTIESTLSQALNSYQHPQVHITGGPTRGLSGQSVSVPSTTPSAGGSVTPQLQLLQPQLKQVQLQQLSNLQSVVNQTPHSMINAGVNKSGQKFGAKKRSWVWNWFVQDSQDANLAVCDQCGKVIRRLPSDKGSPKKLSEHLRTHKIDKFTDNPGREHMIGVVSLPNKTLKLGPHHHQAHPHNSTASSSNSSTLKSVNPGGLGHIPQHLLLEFDISQYSQIKFHKDIMKFLTDNKLPISVVKSPSFRQMVFTLRPESVEDLNELNNIYASLMEVLKNNDTTTPNLTPAF